MRLKPPILDYFAFYSLLIELLFVFHQNYCLIFDKIEPLDQDQLLFLLDSTLWLLNSKLLIFIIRFCKEKGDEFLPKYVSISLFVSDVAIYDLRVLFRKYFDYFETQKVFLIIMMHNYYSQFGLVYMYVKQFCLYFYYKLMRGLCSYMSIKRGMNSHLFKDMQLFFAFCV